MRLSRLVIAAACAALLVTVVPNWAFAQFTSSITGTVFDPSGAAVPGATVNVAELSTGVIHTATSSSAGIFRIAALPAGTFRITVEAKGFETWVLDNVTVQSAETRTVSVELKLGAAATSVTVSAEVASQVNLTSGAVSGQINETKVHDLPLVGRNMYSLVVLTPGVTGTPSGGGQAYAQATADIFNAEYGVNMNANGQRAESNNFQVDSADVNGGPRGGVTNLTPNADSIQEVSILTNNFSAEYGRNAGAIVQVATKAGTNQFHGTLSWFHSDTALNSRTIYQSTAPSFVRNEGAWTLGGPIRKDKDFAFGSMDFLRSSVGDAFPSQIFTPDFINYLKGNYPNNVSTQVLTQFPTSFEPNRNFLTAGSIQASSCTGATPISTPVGTLPCNFPVAGTGDFSTSIFRNGIQWSARVDHNWNDFKDHLYGSVYRTTRQTVEFASPSVYYPAFSPAEPQYTMLINLNWSHTINDHFVNQMTGAYTRTFGNDICDHCEVPATSVGDGTATPGNGFFGLFKQNNYEWKDVAALTTGIHNFKFGANVARHHDDELFTGNTERPSFFFVNSLTYAADQAFSESNIAIDPRTGEQKAVNVDFAYRSTDLGYFLQDDIKVRPNLTLNAGIRSDIFTGPTERFDRLNNISFLNGGDTYQERFANASMQHTAALWHTRLNNFAPRLGFAWDPSKRGKFSIRGGFGLFYDRPTQQLYTGDRSNLPYAAVATACVCQPPTQPAYGLGASGQSPFNFPVVPGITSGLDAKNGNPSAPAFQETTDAHLQTQYGENWSFSIQYEVLPGWVAEAAYLGSQGHHLYAGYDVNRYAGSLIQNNGNFVRLNTSFAGMDYGQANFNSSYNGGTLAIHNRSFSKGINFQAAYTYGKAIDQAGSYGPGLGVVDAVQPNLQRGLGDADVRERLSFSVLWRLPHINSNSAWANALVNGWQVSNITILQSGVPYTVFCDAPFNAVFDSSGNVVGNTGCDFNADGFNYDFPMGPANYHKYNGLSRSQFIKGGIFGCATNASGFVPLCPNTFPTPGLGQEGALGRNTFIGPGFANTDLSLLKENKIPWFVGHEGAILQIRAEFYNAFNRVNLSGVSSDLTNPATLGQANGTFPARDIQLGLRIQF
ncbi:MAG TPA: carboxypeptidase regulatory-like domain-containing protein [Terriglobia bacterium]|nr:carboxypeptidase regulatory-like domain-containing protein [Terriglobia bacterium]